MKYGFYAYEIYLINFAIIIADHTLINWNTILTAYCSIEEFKNFIISINNIEKCEEFAEKPKFLKFCNLFSSFLNFICYLPYSYGNLFYNL